MMRASARLRVYFEHVYPELLEAVEQRSVRSYGGRRKVDAGSGAFGMMGGFQADFGSSPTPSKKRDREEHLNDIEEYLQPTGLMMCQPEKMKSRTETTAFGNPQNGARHVVPPSGIKSTGWQTIDARRVKYWSVQVRRNFPGQNGIMGCSAQDAAIWAMVQHVLVTGETRQWEWLHLCAFKMGGMDNDPQQPGNLVAGTYDCNTAMITLEDAIKRLALAGYVFEVMVEALLYPGTHLAMEIRYHVRCNGRTSTTHFFPMSTDEVMRGEIGVAMELLKAFFDGD